MKKMALEKVLQTTLSPKEIQHAEAVMIEDYPLRVLSFTDVFPILKMVLWFCQEKSKLKVREECMDEAAGLDFQTLVDRPIVLMPWHQMTSEVYQHAQKLPKNMTESLIKEN